MVMVNFLTIDHGVNIRVSRSRSVPCPLPPETAICFIEMHIFISTQSQTFWPDRIFRLNFILLYTVAWPKAAFLVQC